MRLLLDTHILLWAAGEPHRLDDRTRELLEDPTNALIYSAASIWEVAIKTALDRDAFRVSPTRLRQGLEEAGYAELPIDAAHAAAVSALPALHRDPFDRILVAQARIEGVTLLTRDDKVAAYGAPVERVGAG